MGKENDLNGNILVKRFKKTSSLSKA